MSTKTITYEDTPYTCILTQIDQLNAQNKKLLTLAQHIMRTSISQIPAKPPAIIIQIQQDLRAGFNTLVEALRQYFDSIDQRLKQIQSAMPEKQLTCKPASKHYNTEMATLAQRIEQLEHNLKKTQQNQTKMLEIIEKIVEPPQESTMLSQQKPAKYYQTNLSMMRSEQTSSPQLYPRPYSVIESDHCQLSFKREPSMPYCFGDINHRVKSIPLHKRSLKGQREVEQAKRSHKMNYMMNLLKQ